MLGADEISRLACGAVSMEEVFSVLAYASTSAIKVVSLEFSVEGCDYLKQARLIISVPLDEAVAEWVGFEAWLSPEVPAKDFIARAYNELVGRGFSVTMSKDGLFIHKERVRNVCLRTLVEEICKVVEGRAPSKIEYRGYSVMEEW